MIAFNLSQPEQGQSLPFSSSSSSGHAFVPHSVRRAPISLSSTPNSWGTLLCTAVALLLTLPFRENPSMLGVVLLSLAALAFDLPGTILAAFTGYSTLTVLSTIILPAGSPYLGLSSGSYENLLQRPEWPHVSLLLVSLALRMGLVGSALIHEWGHVAAGVATGHGRELCTRRNLLGNTPLSVWLSCLNPFTPIPREFSPCVKVHVADKKDVCQSMSKRHLSRVSSMQCVETSVAVSLSNGSSVRQLSSSEWPTRKEGCIIRWSGWFMSLALCIVGACFLLIRNNSLHSHYPNSYSDTEVQGSVLGTEWTGYRQGYFPEITAHGGQWGEETFRNEAIGFGSSLVPLALILGMFCTLIGSTATDILGWQADAEGGVEVHSEAFFCGNFGLIVCRSAKHARERVLDALSVLEAMAAVSSERGGQSGGLVTLVAAPGTVGKGGERPQLKGVRVRVLPSKRQSLSRLLGSRFRSACNRASSVSLSSLISRPLSLLKSAAHTKAASGADGTGGSGSVEVYAGHTRFATSSLPSVAESHPHQWTPDQTAKVWRVQKTVGADGRASWQLAIGQETMGIYITHNGDFEFWNLYGRDRTHSEVGDWLERLLSRRAPAQCDSAMIAGLLELLRTQGVWLPSLRLAFQQVVVRSFEDVVTPPSDAFSCCSAPSEACLRILADIANKTLTALLQAKGDIVGASADAGYSSGSQHPAEGGEGWGEGSLDAGKRATGGDLRRFLGPSFVEELNRSLRDALRADAPTALRHLASSTEQRLVGDLDDRSLHAFVAQAVSNFLDNDLFWAVKKFIAHAKGSFGLAACCTLDADRIVISALSQPLAIGFAPNQRAALYSSETHSLKVALSPATTRARNSASRGEGDEGAQRESGVEDDIERQAQGLEEGPVEDKKENHILFRLDLDEADGEVVELKMLNEIGQGVGEDRGEVGGKEGRGAELQAVEADSEFRNGSELPLSANEGAGHLANEGGGHLATAVEAPGSDGEKGERFAEEASRHSRGEGNDRRGGVGVMEEGPTRASRPFVLAEAPFVQIRMHNRRSNKTVGPEDLRRGRLIFMVDNPYVSLDFPEKCDDVIGRDLKEIPRVLNIIRDEWASPNYFATRPRTISWGAEDSLSADPVLETNGVRTGGGGGASLNRRTGLALFEMLREVASAREREDGGGGINRREIDVLVTGVENSLWVGEQFAADLQNLLPQLRVVPVSANKVIGVIGNARGAISTPGFSFCGIETALTSKTIVIALSQSGQTFPTLHATRILSKQCPGRVFVCVGMLDSKMSAAVGQSFSADAPFTSRIMCTNAGWRSAEPASLSVAAAHATLTELMLLLAKELRGSFPKRNALGLRLTMTDVTDMERMRDSFVDQASVNIVGTDAQGFDVPSDENLDLVTQGFQWGLHVLESPIGWFLAALYIFVTVVFGIPIFNSIRRALPLEGDTKTAFTYIAHALDAAVYCYLPIITALIQRVITGRQLMARLGTRTIVIADIPYVHQVLENFVSKMFSLSYWFASVDVHGANPLDHFVHRFTHRVKRGVLLAIGRPDGRICSQTKCESWVLMALLQARTIVNLNAGAEAVTIGHNPHTSAVIKHHIVLKSSRPQFLCEKLLGVNQHEPMKRIASRKHAIAESAAGGGGRNAFEELEGREVIGAHLCLESTVERAHHQWLSFVARGRTQIEEAETDDPSLRSRMLHSHVMDHNAQCLLDSQLPLEEITENRFLSLERLIAFQVMFHSMAQTVSSVWPIQFDTSRSQSCLRIATTAAPVSAADLEREWSENANEAARDISVHPRRRSGSGLGGSSARGSNASFGNLLRLAHAAGSSLRGGGSVRGGGGLGVSWAASSSGGGGGGNGSAGRSLRGGTSGGSLRGGSSASGHAMSAVKNILGGTWHGGEKYNSSATSSSAVKTAGAGKASASAASKSPKGASVAKGSASKLLSKDAELSEKRVTRVEESSPNPRPLQGGSSFGIIGVGRRGKRNLLSKESRSLSASKLGSGGDESERELLEVPTSETTETLGTRRAGDV
eukprot:TRINITY_DN1964_c1_g1_i1.p1 TRINITY_DN1964_c1_g1~~TRINITY_DN1964_c1_g1_i1.p1  ORF type:complete len:2019 (+),score=294.17 TRINITY_DN1964_c1_g1_i1:315-6371(+)